MSQTKTEDRMNTVPKLPSPAMRAAMAARMDALLREHLPASYPEWRERVQVELAPTPDQWPPLMVFLAAGAPLARRGWAVPDPDDADSPVQRRVRRNKALIIRLLLRGIHRRGEGREAA